MAKAKWTTVAREVIARTEADGTFLFQAPLLDDGVKQVTMRLTVTADRVFEVQILGEPNATLAGFRAWSNL